MKKLFIYTSLIMAGLFSKPALLPSQIDSLLLELFSDAIDFQMSSQGDKGVGVAVVMPDGQMWWGQKGIDQNSNPITDTTLFFSASLTKTFVAACALQLQEEGLLDLDQPYTLYIPAIPNIESVTTLRQMLNHTSGVYDYQENPNWSFNLFSGEAFTPGEVLDVYLDMPHGFAPGTSWSYSSSNYVVLGLVIEAVTNKPLHENLRARFFEPFDLKHTWCGGFEEYPGPDAGMWRRTDAWSDLVDISAYPRITLLTQGYGAGYIVSTPHDMAVWAKALYKDRAVLSEEAYSQMFSVAPQSTVVGGEGFGYGLGIFRHSMNIDNSEFAWGHSGNLIHMSHMYWDDKKDFIVVTMTNSAVNNGSVAFQNIYFPMRDYLVSPTKEIAEGHSLVFYPNPATDEAWAVGDMPIGTEVRVVDLTGRTIFFSQIESPKSHFILDVKGWQTGIYMVNFRKPNGQVRVGKIIREGW
jgi:D-alanyl-D-alanine carboxypeptidase